MDMSNLLPVWIIGAPLVLAVMDRFMTPAAGRSTGGPTGTQSARTMPPSNVARTS